MSDNHDEDKEVLSQIFAKLDARIGAETNGLTNEVPPAASVQNDEDDAERGPLGRDYHLVEKYMTALEIGEPDLVDWVEFKRIVNEYSE